DQLDVTGTVVLNGSQLSIQLQYVPTAGDSYTIIQNDDTDPVTGTFADSAEGAILTSGGYTFRISYQGDDCNDVTLTYLAPPPVAAAAPPADLAVATDMSASHAADLAVAADLSASHPGTPPDAGQSGGAADQGDGSQPSQSSGCSMSGSGIAGLSW